jgi:hypothetical protein
MAYNEGYTTAEITTSQFVLGIIGILLINLSKNKKKKNTAQASKQNIFQLMLAGTLGMTSILLFSRKIYSCFHWDCIDAKRVDGGVTRNVLRKKLPSAQKW